MGIFKRRENRAGGEVQIEEGLLRSLLGETTITREIALQVPTVSGGIDMIAGIVAGTPIKLYREDVGKAEEVLGDPRLRLLNDETGDTLNANEFWRAMVRDYYLGKGGYAFIDRRGGSIAGLYYVDERRVVIQYNADPIFKEYDLLVGGQRYRPHDFLRILRNTRDGAAGVPITQESTQLIDVAYQSLRYEDMLVRKGGNKKGFLQAVRRLSDDGLKRLKDDFRRMYGNNEESVVVLNDGMTFKESSNTSVEMQLNENKKSNADELAKIFHLPAGVIGGRASQDDVASLARLAAIPLMTAIQCALNRDLLLEREKGEMYFAFDTKELLKGDMQTRFAAYKTALDANFMQIDEVRFAEDLEPLGLTWIKLGLNDVLYDPKTKTVYTPNTDKTSNIGENGLSAEAAHGIIEPRAKRIKGEDGKFNGSVSEGGGAAAASDAPEVSATGANRFEKGFSKRNLDAHWDGEHTHKEQYPGMTKEQYAQRARQLIEKPVGKGILGYKNSSGQIVRYDSKTNDFVKGRPDKGIATMFKPSKGRDYYERKKAEEGIDDE
ncbi:MAG: phage portal protein [Candidatus Spyradocola sp.]